MASGRWRRRDEDLNSHLLPWDGVHIKWVRRFASKAISTGRIVPDEPVDVPAGTEAVVDFAVSEAIYPLPNPRGSAGVVGRTFGGAVKGIGIPLESLRRENLYEDR